MPRRLIFVVAACLLALAATAGGCQQKMADQPSFSALEQSDFFADGRSSRPLPLGTVARGQLRIDTAFFTGRKTRSSARPQPLVPAQEPKTFAERRLAEDRDFVDYFPLPIDEQTIQHGRDRYTIYCIVCHDPLGTGHGKIVERGYTQPPSYHIPRLREAPVGRLFAVVSDGYGSMPSYSAQIPVEDRWAIVAYLRALQASQHFPESDLPPGARSPLAAISPATTEPPTVAGQSQQSSPSLP